MSLEFLQFVIGTLQEMKKQEVRYMDVPRRVGKSKAAASLTGYNIAVLSGSSAQEVMLTGLGANPRMVFSRISQMRGNRFSGIIIDEGFSRLNLNKEIKELKVFDCPILVLGTSRFSERLSIKDQSKERAQQAKMVAKPL